MDLCGTPRPHVALVSPLVLGAVFGIAELVAACEVSVRHDVRVVGARSKSNSFLLLPYFLYGTYLGKNASHKEGKEISTAQHQLESRSWDPMYTYALFDLISQYPAK